MSIKAVNFGELHSNIDKIVIGNIIFINIGFLKEVDE